MKKILISLFLMLLPLVAVGQETRAQATSNLMGLGMPGALASEVAGIATGLGVLPNASYLLARNAADSANINVLRVDSTDDTLLNADTGDLIKFGVGGTAIIDIASTGIFPATDGSASVSLGTTSAGWKTINLSDATNRSSILQSTGLYISYPAGESFFIRENATEVLNIAATTKAATFAGAVSTGGNLTMAAGILNVGANFETVAGAGTTVADAGQLSATKMFHQVTGANGTVGVKFATASAGQVHYILNTTAGVLKVYAASGGTVNGGAADAAFSALTGIKPILCVSTGSNTWICS